MKKEYEKPEVEISEFELEEFCESGGMSGGDY